MNTNDIIHYIAKKLKFKLLEDYPSHIIRNIFYNKSRYSAIDNEEIVVYRIEDDIVVFSKIDHTNSSYTDRDYYQLYKFDLRTMKPTNDSFYQIDVFQR